MFVVFLAQELEQELAEQKSLLRSVASQGEEILTRHSAAGASGAAGYVRTLSLLGAVFSNV